ncbi:MAG: EAL domain-containing protein [Gammaproteobacteria bacterium]|nr:EAL domain-containing protein [Gammaproteobacteria bacterium]
MITIQCLSNMNDRDENKAAGGRPEARLILKNIHNTPQPRYIQVLVVSFLAGACIFSLFVIWQQLQAGSPVFSIKTTIIPFLAGGSVGMIMGLWRYRLLQAATVLLETEDRCRCLVEASADGIGAVCEGILLDLNAAGMRLLGMETPEELAGREMNSFIHPDHRKSVESYMEKALNHTAGAHWLKTGFIGRGDAGINVELKVTGSFQYHGKPAFLLVFRNFTMPETEEENALSMSVMERTDEGVMVSDSNRSVIKINKAFTRITGYSEEEVIGKTCGFLQPEQRDDELDRTMWACVNATGQWEGEIRVRCKNGEVRPQWENISVISGEKNQAYLALFSDISLHKCPEQYTDSLAYHAHHDSLTGLPNQLLLKARLGHALEGAALHQTGVAVLWLDIDRFKRINNTLGHHIGDQMLLAIAKRLTDCLKSIDKETTVARARGDEFTVILEEVENARKAGFIARKILAGVIRPMTLEDREVTATMSIGISLYPEDGKDDDTLLKMADAAMYRAKEQGGNSYQFYEASITAKSFEHLLLESGLWGALARDEFELYYQPQIALDSGSIVGAEALIRWHHPEQGLILPGKFIQLAEETGLIDDIGNWVLRTACMQNKDWQYQGLPPVRIAVNLSGRQIVQENTIETLMAILHESRLPPRWVKLEVTETFIIGNPEQAISNLRALKKLGVSLSIDDFGTGYSAISYLKELPMEELKIDRSFVKDILSDSSCKKITAAIIALGHSLQLNVLAEGVETREQMAVLRSINCDVMQGYLYSPPVPAAEFANLLKVNSMLPMRIEN